MFAFMRPLMTSSFSKSRCDAQVSHAYLVCDDGRLQCRNFVRV